MNTGSRETICPALGCETRQCSWKRRCSARRYLANILKMVCPVAYHKLQHGIAIFLPISIPFSPRCSSQTPRKTPRGGFCRARFFKAMTGTTWRLHKKNRGFGCTCHQDSVRDSCTLQLSGNSTAWGSRFTKTRHPHTGL